MISCHTKGMINYVIFKANHCGMRIRFGPEISIEFRYIVAPVRFSPLI